MHCPTIDSDEKRLSQTIVLLEVKFISPQLSIYQYINIFRGQTCWILSTETLFYIDIKIFFINYIVYLFLFINNIIVYCNWKERSGNLGGEEKEGGREGGTEGGMWGWAGRRTWLRVSGHGISSTRGCLLAF